MVLYIYIVLTDHDAMQSACSSSTTIIPANGVAIHVSGNKCAKEGGW